LHSSKASGATPAGALTHPHGGYFTNSKDKIPKVSTPATTSGAQASAGLIHTPTKARGLLSGTIIWRHPNLGIKMPLKTRNTIKQLGQMPHPGAVPSSMLGRQILSSPKAPLRCLAIIYAWTPKSSPGVKSPNMHLAHDSTPRYDSFEASQAAEQSPPRPRPPCRGPWQHTTSSPRPRVRGLPSESMRTPPRSRSPRPSLPRGLGTGGKLRLAREPPRQTGTMILPLDKTSAFIAKPPRGMVIVSGDVSSHAAQRTRPESRPPTPVTVPPFPAVCGLARRYADMSNTAPATVLPNLCTPPSAGLSAGMGNDPRTRYDH
jgi:hypothetical protein